VDFIANNEGIDAWFCRNFADQAWTKLRVQLPVANVLEAAGESARVSSKKQEREKF
jgi:hypothetical protein